VTSVDNIKIASAATRTETDYCHYYYSVPTKGVGVEEAGINYRGLAVQKGARSPTIVPMFMSFSVLLLLLFVDYTN
jgi:hypothetical protein